MSKLDQLRLWWNDPTTTDDQRIEKVAVEVMKWKTKRSGRGYDTLLFRRSDRTGPWCAWDPLGNWNHTMEAVDRLESLGFDWRIDGRPGLQRGCRIAPLGEFNTPRVQFVADESAQRAVCLAALLAVAK